MPIITGSDAAFSTPSEAEAWISDPANPITYPVIVKAARGGGGRGIRIVPTAADLEPMFRLASNEALNAFGDGRCFVEKYVDSPRHIEVQCLGEDGGVFLLVSAFPLAREMPSLRFPCESNCLILTHSVSQTQKAMAPATSFISTIGIALYNGATRR